MSWITAHCYYHQDPAVVITSVVAPTVRALGDRAPHWFYVRYWTGGPHVRFRLWVPDPDDRETAREEVRSRFGDLVAQRPSRVEADPADFQRLADLIGNPGDEAGADILPDNTLTWESYRPETELYGGPAAMEHVEEFFTASSRDALAYVGTPTDPVARAVWCMASGLATVGDADWVNRFVDHMVGRWIGEQIGAQWQRVVDQSWQRSGDRVRHLVRHALTASPSGGEGEWLGACQRLQEGLADVEARGLLEPAEGAAPDGLAHLDRGMATLSALHMHNNRLGVHMEREALVMELLRLALADTVTVRS
ncbi:thiopeptide-type bacteriocin biosynthesis protein [Nocardiopsis sp. SBT366]|uniref:thiopeptide-type bacteriocin biosynthesis protein n=1 Tax=Nocardiopsis sp. SBT366 TaxID=1580529 RepID=UPI00066C856D|nr:thiopeptide-type bacteriocin biosynthesis protein [Nocardiopsis sp. SBT366]